MRRILSIDGGGIRGVFPAAYLAQFENEVDRPLYKYFDLIAGTSTGGIVAIGLAMGISANEILELYESRGEEIFSQQRTGIIGLTERCLRKFKWQFWGPKYNTNALQAILKEVLGERKIGEAKTRLFIPAWHQQMGSVYIFKTAHHERLRTDYKEFAREAAMATSAAPTYFQEFITSRDVGLVDGGVWANNPAGVAVAEGIGTLNWPPSEIRVLSIGCLENVVEMRDAYGAVRLTPKLAGLFMAGQSHGSLSLAHILTGDVGGADHKAIFRVTQLVPDKFFSLDDTTKIQKLKSRAFAQARTDKPDLLRVFFHDEADPFKPIYCI